MKIKFSISPILLILFLTGCASYYQVNQEFNRNFEQGRIEAALNALEKQPKKEEGKQAFLYFVNKGALLSMLGKYEESNSYFEKAYLFGEDFRKDYFLVAASYLSNPQIKTYPGEDHEHLMLLYYKALNFMRMGLYEEALVECRRMNLRLLALADRYPKDTKFKKDAFVHNLMGIIYDATNDYNNAFIAYRNAVEIYQNEYKELFGMQVPQQLKYDLLRAAYRMGFMEEFNFYKKEFDLSGYEVKKVQGAELVFFWNNGLGPVKGETSINFATVPGNGGVVNFTNEDMGISFPFTVDEEEERNSITDLNFVRVAFPKYVERPLFYNEAFLTYEEDKYPLYLAEDVNAIAFKSLHQRMLREVGQGLLRLALKQVAAEGAREENEGLGMAVSLLNALTEKADTRNWQTLPHSIYYTRIPLDTGTQKVELEMQSPDGDIDKQEFVYEVVRGKTIFQSYSSLESDNISYLSY